MVFPPNIGQRGTEWCTTLVTDLERDTDSKWSLQLLSTIPLSLRRQTSWGVGEQVLGRKALEIPSGSYDYFVPR
jgi:hypothetical protein